MSEADFSGLKPVVVERLGPFVEALREHWGGDLSALFVVGSAVTVDFDPKTSDINTLAVLEGIRFRELSGLAKLGGRFGKKGISAPMLFTREMIDRSLDVFPVGFLTFKLHHRCVLGDQALGEGLQAYVDGSQGLVQDGQVYRVDIGYWILGIGDWGLGIQGLE